MGKEIKLAGITERMIGIPVADVDVGDVLIWDYGTREKVLDITPSKSGKTVLMSLRRLDTGEETQKIIRNSKLVVVEHKSEPIDNALFYRKVTNDNFFEEIDAVLKPFLTTELVDYVIIRLKGEKGLRHYLEQQITSAEIMKLKNKK